MSRIGTRQSSMASTAISSPVREFSSSVVWNVTQLSLVSSTAATIASNTTAVSTRLVVESTAFATTQPKASVKATPKATET